MNLQQLRQKKADAINAARKLHTVAEAANRMLTAEENTQYDALMAEAKSYDTPISQKEVLLEAERTAPAIVPGALAGHDHAQDRPFASLGEQLSAVVDAGRAMATGSRIDPRLYGALGSNESVDAEAGFLVAPEFSPEFLQRTYEEGQLTSRCRTIPMNSNRLVINGLDEDSRVAGSRYGGIQVYRIAEAANYTGTKPKFRQIQITANKLIGLMYATDEILEDTDALASWATQNFPKAFAFQLDDEVLNGTGAGQMLGVLASGAAITVAKDSGQATATISATNIFNMIQRLWVPSRKNAAFFYNVDLDNMLWNLTRGSGTAVELLYTPPGSRGNTNSYGMLMGYPMIPVEQAAAAGTVGDIVLADMSQYLIGERKGLSMATSIHVQFLTGEQVFRWTLRNDGQPIVKKPLTPYKGSTTTSPFVTLAARP